MGSVILDQSKIEDFAFIAAGAIVPPGSKVGTESYGLEILLDL